jgi:hypothetical protein
MTSNELISLLRAIKAHDGDEEDSLSPSFELSIHALCADHGAGKVLIAINGYLNSTSYTKRVDIGDGAMLLGCVDTLLENERAL